MIAAILFILAFSILYDTTFQLKKSLKINRIYSNSLKELARQEVLVDLVCVEWDIIGNTCECYSNQDCIYGS